MSAEHTLDFLGFVPTREISFSIRFGATEVFPSIANAQATSAMNKQPSATVILDRRLLPAEPIDYLATVTYAAEIGGVRYPRFTGAVVSATPIGETIEINALGATQLGERIVPSFSASGVTTPEIIHFLTRSSGMRDEQLNIEGLDELPVELFEVLAPVENVTVSERVRVGKVTLLPHPLVAPRVKSIGPFADATADSYAITYVLGRRMLDAEELGLSRIDESLAWLVTRARYGAALLPDGTVQSFERSAALSQPKRCAYVFVRALASQRRWTHETRDAESATGLALRPDHPFLVGAEGLSAQSDQTRQALLALARATTEPDALARVGALWEAVEFFVGGYRLKTKLFSTRLRQEIISGLPEELDGRQRYRIEKLINDQLNNAPLRQKLEKVLDHERVPHTDAEVETLFGLRANRNRALHGRAREAPAEEDIQQATALVARMLVYRVWHAAG